MPTYPTSTGSLNYIAYPAGPTATGTNVTASGSANTKGSYTEFIASSPFAAQTIWLMVHAATNNSALHLTDIATGAGGAETVVIANLMYSHRGTTSANAIGFHCHIPLAIPTSTRIALRTQSTTGSNVSQVSVGLSASNGAVGLTATETIGVNTSTSHGTTVDAGGTANTKGSYGELSASTGALYQCATVVLSDAGGGASGGVSHCVDIATGAGGAEVVLMPDLRTHTATTWLVPDQVAYTLLTYIAASTRIAARASCDSNSSPLRTVDVSIVGGTAPAESSGLTIAIQSPAIIWPGGCASY